MTKESEESGGLFPTIKKMKKSFFPSGNSITPSNKFSSKQKTIRS